MTDPKVESFFRYSNVDLSKYIPDPVYKGAHIARFIKNNIRQGIPLKLITDLPSNINSLMVGNQCLMNFICETGTYQLNNIFYNHAQIIDIPHFHTDMYYLREIIKNVVFMEYLMTGHDLYSQLIEIINSNEKISSTFIESDNWDNDYFNIIFNDENISIYFFKREIKISIQRNNESVYFSLEIDQGGISKFFKFDKFIVNLNRFIYDYFVYKPLKIPVSEFTIRHRELVNIFEH